jgi:peptidoglycan/LPS O-acetylase OafA/YrhL
MHGTRYAIDSILGDTQHANCWRTAIVPAHSCSMPAERPTFTGVQVLRFVAALLVVFSHLPTYLHARLGTPLVDIPVGQVGVTVFFAISGFVAVLVTQRTPRPTWREFISRRLVRILPLAWAVMTIKLGTLLVAPQALERATTSPTYIALSYVFLPGRGPNGVVEPFYTVTWTLSFELLFYVVVTIALATRIDPLRLASVVFVGLAVASAFRGPDGWPVWQFHANRIVLCFLVGMVIGRWALDRRTRLALLRTAAITAIWLVAGTVAGASVPSLLLLPLAAAALATTVVSEPLLRRCAGTVGRTLGDASYALYLTHPIVAPATVAVVAAVVSGPAAPVVAGIAAPVAAVAASVVVWFAVDRPVIRQLQRRRTTPPRTPRTARHRLPAG